MPDAGGYRFLKQRLPKKTYDLFQECYYVAEELLALHGGLPDPGTGRDVEIFESIFQAFLVEGSVELHAGRLARYGEGVEARRREQKFERMRLDGFACMICGHTRSGGRTLGVHHVVPLGYKPTPNDRIPAPEDYDALTNLAALCNFCHDWAHEHWRVAARHILQRRGDPAYLVFKDAGY